MNFIIKLLWVFQIFSISNVIYEHLCVPCYWLLIKLISFQSFEWCQLNWTFFVMMQSCVGWTIWTIGTNEEDKTTATKKTRQHDNETYFNGSSMSKWKWVNLIFFYIDLLAACIWLSQSRIFMNTLLFKHRKLQKFSI